MANPLKNKNKASTLTSGLGLAFGYPLSQQIVMIGTFSEVKLFSIKLKSFYRLSEIQKDIKLIIIVLFVTTKGCITNRMNKL